MRQIVRHVLPESIAGRAAPAGLLSNGSYTVLLTAAGTGLSVRRGIALTRGPVDRVEDREGFFLYLRDRESGRAWSAGFAPTRTTAARYEARREPGRFVIERDDDGITTRCEVAVDPDADREVRRLTLSNRSDRPRRIEVTSCLEVVLNDPAAHAAHPAFSKLFIQTEWNARYEALLAHRRPRGHGETHPWMAHAVWDTGEAAAPGSPGSHPPGETPRETSRETDRARFLGRGRRWDRPLAISTDQPLSGATGNVLDPVLALRREVVLAPGGGAELTFLLGAADTREEALRLVTRSRPAVPRDAGRPGGGMAGEPASEGDEIFTRAAEREAALSDPSGSTAEDLWRSEALAVEMLLGGADRGERPDSPAADAPRAEIRKADPFDRPRGSASDPKSPAASPSMLPLMTPADLCDWNGYGGFTRDGREYVILLPHIAPEFLRLPPRPWINCIANERFGFLVSETGAGYTWSGNSREHRLTPWYNDPLVDPHGEALYIRDENTGEAWSPLPGPIPGNGDYQARHGFGYSAFRMDGNGLSHETTIFASRHDPVKVTRVRVYNLGSRERRLSLFGWQRLVLGGLPEESGRSVVTELVGVGPSAGLSTSPPTSSPAGGPPVLLARNRMADEYADSVAFATVTVGASGSPRPSFGFTTDRATFLGRFGDPSFPRALAEPHLDGRLGAGLDPCFALQATLELAPGDAVEVSFLLGEGRDEDAARSLAVRYGDPAEISAAEQEVRDWWADLLGRLQVRTPDPSLDVLMNGWLPYQVLSCRLWGRSALYQSGGAYGFRDQLQDAGMFSWTRPELLRGQILLHAAHQFVEGDVLHWWHPPQDRGLRTRFTDDLLWLPHLAAWYLRATGDRTLLDETAPFLTASALSPDEDEVFLQPAAAGEGVSVYEHCCRAIDRSLTTGSHGLPLFGSGDWNDGMNRVGREGRGESTFVGFFLFTVLGEFAPLCRERGDDVRASRYESGREALRAALEASAWDGEWYRRGYYDDGVPLGSRESDECRIDALAQSWAVISGAAPPARARQAMQSVARHLVDEEAGIIRLLTPAFENTPHDPGYIKGYVPGVRENGGQYTHAACWVVAAAAQLGWSERIARWLDCLNPAAHARTPGQVAVYQVEPYVVAADIYGEPPHVGRGGWTWYTGSAGWMYRVVLESVLGLVMEGGARLRVRPCLPPEWPGCSILYTLPGDDTVYEITVGREGPPGGAGSARGGSLDRAPSLGHDTRPGPVLRADHDGAPAFVEDGVAVIPLHRDGGRHRVTITLD